MPVAAGPDADVADPDRAGVLALQRALVEHVAAAVRHGVVDPEPVLLVLGLVGEVDAEQLRRAAGAGVLHVADQPDEVAAEGDDDLLEGRVPADDGVVLTAVDRAGAQSWTETRVTARRRPRGRRRRRSTWRGRSGRGRRGLGEGADLDDQLAPGDVVAAGAGEAEVDRAVELSLGGHTDDGRAAAALPGERGEPVGRLGQALEQRVIGLDAGQLDALGQVRRPGQVGVGRAPSRSARTRFIGVKRHVSSRPVGTPKASGSSEVNRSAGEPVGAGPPCECAPGATPVASAGVVGGPACAPTPGAKSSQARCEIVLRSVGGVG